MIPNGFNFQTCGTKTTSFYRSFALLNAIYFYFMLGCFNAQINKIDIFGNYICCNRKFYVCNLSYLFSAFWHMVEFLKIDRILSVDNWFLWIDLFYLPVSNFGSFLVVIFVMAITTIGYGQKLWKSWGYLSKRQFFAV